MNNLSLGPLEQEVMKCVWKHKCCSAREVVKCIRQDRQVAYNTIQTVMTRLVEKNFLTRSLKGKCHYYQAKRGQKNTITSIIHQSLGSFHQRFGEQALIAFVDGLDDMSDETRRKLIKKLEQK